MQPPLRSTNAPDPPPPAIDHDAIPAAAFTRLRGKRCGQPIGFGLIPETFTLTQLQQHYPTVNGTPPDERNFRKNVLGFDLLLPLEERPSGGDGAGSLRRWSSGCGQSAT